MFCCNGEMRNVVFFPQMLCHNFVRIASKSQSLPVYVQRRYRYKRQWVTCHRIVYFFVLGNHALWHVGVSIYVYSLFIYLFIYWTSRGYANCC